VLSGFVIALAADGRIISVRSAANFLTRRIGRIGPLHWLMLAAFVIAVAAKPVLDAARGAGTGGGGILPAAMVEFIVQNLFLVQIFRTETVFWLNAPSWSISAELWNYVLFAAFGVIAHRYFSLLAGVAVLVGFAVTLDIVDPGFGHFFEWGLFRCMCRFFIGYFTYRIWKSIRGGTLPAATAIEATALTAAFGFSYFSDIRLINVITPFVFAGVILVFSFQQGRVSALLQKPLFTALGAWSYSIYMVHFFILFLIGVALRAIGRLLQTDLSSPSRAAGLPASLIDFGNPYVMDLFSLAVLVIVILVSSRTYAWIELPGQALSRRLADRWFPSPTRPPPA
jgi:peptidoglycan/LPS O-acetylase OafA/YrhL